MEGVPWCECLLRRRRAVAADGLQLPQSGQRLYREPPVQHQPPVDPSHRQPYAGTGIDLEYRYGAAGSATNGRLWQVKDWVSGEEVTCQYDALNRLTQAITTDPTAWGRSFVYDGFGNLTQQIKSAQHPGGPDSWN